MMKLDITLDTKSVARLTVALQNKQTKLQEAARTGVMDMAEKIFQQAQSRVPVATGALRASGKVTSSGPADAPQSIISYGDTTVGARGRPTSEYGIVRHELRSKRNPDSYKWLEKSLLEADAAFREEAIRLLREALLK